MTTSNQVRLAAPASAGVLIAVAVVLVLTGIAFLLLAGQPNDRLLSTVALANTTSGFVLAFWLFAGWTGFSGGGRLLVGITVVGLLVVAVVELLATWDRS